MNILVAPDKFRGSLEAAEVCNAVEAGILALFPDANVFKVPLADGGEGTSSILTQQSGGSYIATKVSDPFRRPVEAGYGISSDRKTAFIEMAAASGLRLLAESERDPTKTSTFGTGELILDAASRGVEEIILGIGGSATTDGGTGMAAAFGYRFLDKNGEELEANGGNLDAIVSIDDSKVNSAIKKLRVTVACDVTNPLFGKDGAAYIYGPQKGADPEMVLRLDEGLRNLSEVASNHFGSDVSSIAGAGAAGGLGAGCMWFLGATLRDGISIVMDHSGVPDLIRKSDLVITGEGKVDEQTLNGKVVKGLANLCGRYKVPLAVLCGTLQISPEQSRAAGITFVSSVLNRPMDLSTAQDEAFTLVRDATFHLAGLFFSRELR